MSINRRIPWKYVRGWLFLKDWLCYFYDVAGHNNQNGITEEINLCIKTSGFMIFKYVVAYMFFFKWYLLYLAISRRSSSVQTTLPGRAAKDKKWKETETKWEETEDIRESQTLGQRTGCTEEPCLRGRAISAPSRSRGERFVLADLALNLLSRNHWNAFVPPLSVSPMCTKWSSIEKVHCCWGPLLRNPLSFLLQNNLN